MIAGGDPRDVGADLLDDARPLMAEDQWKAGEPSVAGEDVGVAEAGRMNADQDLIIRSAARWTFSITCGAVGDLSTAASIAMPRERRSLTLVRGQPARM
ncbi:MAG: hypothetical protein QOI47_1920, partial [Actinomycetota bacterium]|nr:hypothetical protein [Actinomycetota bacterium]